MIVGFFGLIIFAGLAYYFGLSITALYLGDLSQAQSIVHTYSLFYKILLTVLAGALFGTFFAVSIILYRIGTELFEKHVGLKIQEYENEDDCASCQTWVKDVQKVIERDGFVTWPKLKVELKVGYARIIRTLDYMVRSKILLPPNESGKYFPADPQ